MKLSKIYFMTRKYMPALTGAGIKLFKSVCITSYLFCATVLNAQEHYTINWDSAPLNPVPFAYRSNHLNLKGKVKTLLEINQWKDTITRRFDAAGFIKSVSTAGPENMFPGTTTYTYKFPEGYLTTVWKTDMEEIVYRYKFNKQKQIIESGILTNLKIENPVKYGYDLSGRLAYDSSALTKIYTYNNEGQLTGLQENGLFGVKINSSYTYKKENENLLISILVKRVDGSYTTTTETTETYNPQRELINVAGKKEKKVYYYQFDTMGNWVKRTEVTFSNNAQTNTVETKRIIEYY